MEYFHRYDRVWREFVDLPEITLEGKMKFSKTWIPNSGSFINTPIISEGRRVSEIKELNVSKVETCSCLPAWEGNTAHSEPWKIGRKLPLQTASEAGVGVSGPGVSACHQDQVPSMKRVTTYLPREMWTWLRNNPEDSGVGAGHTESGPVCRESWIISSKVSMSQEH